MTELGLIPQSGCAGDYRTLSLPSFWFLFSNLSHNTWLTDPGQTNNVPNKPKRLREGKKNPQSSQNFKTATFQLNSTSQQWLPINNLPGSLSKFHHNRIYHRVIWQKLRLNDAKSVIRLLILERLDADKSHNVHTSQPVTHN